MCRLFLCVLLSVVALTCHANSFETILDQEEYAEVYQLLMENYDQSQAIYQQVQPYIKFQHQRYLDIGAGDGKLTARMAPHFSAVTVLEPNKNFHKYYPPGEYTILLNPFQLEKFDDQYDFIMLSRVLYHVERSQWPALIEKLVDLKTNQDARAAIIMESASGQLHDLKQVNPQGSINSEPLFGILDTLNINYQQTRTTQTLVLDNFNDMYKVMRFFILENNFDADEYHALPAGRKVELNKAILEKTHSLLQEDGLFKVSWDQDVFIF